MIDFLIHHFVKNYEDAQDPAVRQRYGALSGIIGIFLNLMVSLGKFFGGLVTGSIAITADAFNNLSDAGSSLVTVVGFHMAGKRADDDHPFGHGRIEYLTGLAVAVAILVVGLELGKSSILKILHPEAVSFSLAAVMILCVSIFVKLWMCYFNRGLAKRIGSAAMSATAADSLSDVVTTSAVLLGTLVAHFFHVNIDGWVGIVVAAFILKSGWGAAKDTLNPLLGQSPDPALVRGIQETVLSHKEIQGLHDLIIHDYGPGRSMMSLHAEVPMNADIMEMHDVIDAIERELRTKFRIEASIHMDPIATGDETVNRTHAMMAELVRQIDPEMTIHDFRMTNGPHHRNLIFDVVVPYHVKLTDEEVKSRIETAAKAVDPAYFVVLEIDRAYTERV
ncbi:MAG: cation diffusion facilitator family transporter, partial [Pseudoflavonifractor sp.]